MGLQRSQTPLHKSINIDNNYLLIIGKLKRSENSKRIHITLNQHLLNNKYFIDVYTINYDLKLQFIYANFCVIL